MRSSFILIAVLIAGAWGCKKEPVRWTSDWVVPLAKGKLTISDFVKEDYLTADDQGFLYLTVNRGFNEFNLDSIVSVLDTVIHSQFQLDVPLNELTVPSGFSLFDVVETEQLNVAPIQMRKLKVRSGTLTYSVKNTFTAPLDVSYQVPSVVIGGTPYGLQTSIDGRNGSALGLASGSADLAGAEFDLRGPGLNSFNVIHSIFNVVVAPGAGDEVTVSVSDSIVVDLAFEDVVIEYALGYFGKHTITETITLPLDDIKQIGIEELQLGSANFDFHLRNYSGVDFSLKIDDLRAERGVQQVSLEAQPLASSINLARAYDYGGTVEPQLFSASINETNSQILDFLGLVPEVIEMDYTLKVNPLGDISGGHDFFYLDRNIEADLDINIPLCLAAKGLVLRDTLDISDEPPVNVSGNIIIRARNAFPFGALLSGRIISPSGETLSTFSVSGTIASGNFDMVSGLTSPVESEHLIYLGDAYKHFVPENKIEVSMRFDTWNFPEIVKLNAASYIDLIIIGDLSAEIEVD